MRFYTFHNTTKKYYYNIQDAIQNATIHGGSVYDEHERLIVKVVKR